MIISTSVNASRDSFELPQIKLPGETKEFCLFEKSRKDINSKCLGFLYNKCSTMRHPVNDVDKIRSVKYFEKLWVRGEYVWVGCSEDK